MLDSIEVRWFSKGLIPEKIIKFYNLERINSFEIRTDLYFIIKNCDYLGVKIRNKKLEIKWRKNSTQFAPPESDIVGNIEYWTRWEWNDLNAYNDFTKFLNISNTYPVIKIEKKRIQKRFNIHNKKLVEVLSPSQYLNFDCAMEITELIINRQQWWSISFDLLKVEDEIPIFLHLIENQQLDNLGIELKKENSYGFPNWISNIVEYT